MNYKKMPTSQLDKLLLNYVLEGNDSFYSDKQLAEMKVVYDKVLKDLFPEEDPKEIERSNGEFLNMMGEEQARRKLEADAKARRVVIGGETDPMHLRPQPEGTHQYLPGVSLTEHEIVWQSELGTRTEQAYSIKFEGKISKKDLRGFANFILEKTKETTYRGV